MINGNERRPFSDNQGRTKKRADACRQHAGTFGPIAIARFAPCGERTDAPPPTRSCRRPLRQHHLLG